ncbi:MAG: helix-turn-helix transcriptional regulator [Firmicutes bacterium]|nr:helix-turn-helix transcriptional regulator [Bacillota bacterium]
MNAQSAIKKRIFDLITRKNISINKVANEAMLNPATINSILNGRGKRTEVSTIAKICYGLEISMFDFFNDEMFKSIDEYEI